MLGAVLDEVPAAIVDLPGVVAMVFAASADETVETGPLVGSSAGSDTPPTNDPCSLARGVTASASATSSPFCGFDFATLSEETC